VDIYPSLIYRDVEAALEQLQAAGNLWTFGIERPDS
jgi:hypothetical protein